MRQGTVGALVVDDHPEFRHELAAVIDEIGDFVVAGQAPDGASAVRLAHELDPVVVLMDLHMPGMDGIEATAEIMQLDEPPAVIVLTASSASTDVIEAILAGATGYLVKGATPDEIRAAMSAAKDGGAPLCADVAGALIQHVRERRVQNAEPELLPPLTEREAKLLELLASGRGNGQIAEELFVSVATVKSTMATMFEKLGVTSRAQAAVLAVRAGLV